MIEIIAAVVVVDVVAAEDSVAVAEVEGIVPRNM